jgi:DNA-binding NtrC family response regulator
MATRSEAVILSTDWEWRHSLAHTLDANGMDYIFASSVEDCREIAGRECVTLIFWDSHLIDGTCQDLARLIGSLDGRAKIVILSHMDDWGRRLAGARNGAFAVVPFPCQPTDIEWVLSRASAREARSAQTRELQTHA